MNAEPGVGTETSAERGLTSGAMSSLNQGLRILAFVQERGAIRPGNLADQLRMPASTLYRYLSPLVDQGFLIRSDGHVLPGDRLTPPESSSEHLVDFAAPVLRRLRTATGLTALLTVRIHSVGVCLYSASAHPQHLIALRRGAIQPLYAGASVTPLLAYAPSTVLDEVTSGPFRRYTATTPKPVTVQRALRAIRRDGYAITFGELTPGMAAIGMPVLVGGECVCVLSLVGEGRLIADSEPVLNALRPAVQRLADELGRSITDVSWASGGDGYV